MQSVLSIDASGDTVRAVVVKLDQRSLEVVESRSFPAHALFQSESLNGFSPQAEGSAESESELKIDAGEIFGQELRKFQSSWDSAVIVLPPGHGLSLNLNLPFSDRRSLAKILALEVQDVVPFDLNEFLIDHRSFGSLQNGGFDVHVGLIPRWQVKRAIDACRRGGVEPLVVSTASAALGGAFLLAPDYFSGNSAILLLGREIICLVVRINGQLCVDRAQILSAQPDDRLYKNALSEMRLALAAAERRYGLTIEKLYLIGGVPSEIQRQFGRPVERINISEFVRASDEDASIAGFAAIFGQESESPRILTNFRVREFAYNPRIKELLFAARDLRYYILAAVIFCIMAIAGLYAVRAYHIRTMRAALAEQISRVVPDVAIDKENPVVSLSGLAGQLEKQLKDLVSPGGVSPLEVWTNLSKVMPNNPQVSITKFRIKGNKIEIEGSAPDYNAIDQLHDAFQQNANLDQHFFCRPRKEQKGSSGGLVGSGNQRQFLIEVLVCDR